MDAACTYAPPFDAQYHAGNHAVRQVTASLQADALTLLQDRLLLPIDATQAATLASGWKPGAQHHYLAKAAFIGALKPGEALPAGITFNLDVTDTGGAFVSSFRITGDHSSTAQAAVILASDRPLTGVVSICGAAQ